MAPALVTVVISFGSSVEDIHPQLRRQLMSKSLPRLNAVPLSDSVHRPCAYPPVALMGYDQNTGDPLSCLPLYCSRTVSDPLQSRASVITVVL